MEQNGLRPKDLGNVLQSRARASDVLNRKRPLTLSQIRAIRTEWHIPYHVLVQEYAPDKFAK